VVLEKFAKLRASDFDRSKREDDRIPLAISRREPGKGGTATKLPPPVPKTPKVPPKDIPNPIVETIKDVGLITLGVGLVVGATVLAGPTGPDDVAAYGTFATILNKTKLGQQILKNGPKILKALRNADTVKRMNDAIRNKKNFPKLDKLNLEKIKKSDKIIKNLRKEAAAEKILKDTFAKTLREEKNFNLRELRTFLKKSSSKDPLKRIEILEKATQFLRNMYQGISSRAGKSLTSGRKDNFDSYKRILKSYDSEIKKIEQAIKFIKRNYKLTIDKAIQKGGQSIKGRKIKKIQRNLNKTKQKSDLFSFNTFEGNNTTNVINGGSTIAFLPSGGNEINMIELNGYMRQV